MRLLGDLLVVADYQLGLFVYSISDLNDVHLVFNDTRIIPDGDRYFPPSSIDLQKTN